MRTEVLVKQGDLVHKRLNSRKIWCHKLRIDGRPSVSEVVNLARLSITAYMKKGRSHLSISNVVRAAEIHRPIGTVRGCL